MRNLLVALFVLLSTACSHSGTDPASTGDGPGNQPVAIDPGISLAWPPDDSRAASDGSFSFSGFNTSGYNDGTIKGGINIQVRAGDDPFGYVIYKVGGFNSDKAPAGFALNSYALDDDCYVGIANFARNRWQWIDHWEYGSEASWQLSSPLDYISPNTNVFIVFAVMPGEELDIPSGGTINHKAVATPGYPLLGMWYPDFDRDSVADCARYDVIIDDFSKDLHWNEAEGKWSAALRAANPDVVLLNYVAFSEISYEWDDGETVHNNTWLRDWPPGWFLTEAGTTLAAGINASATTIEVSDWQQTGEAQYEMPTTWDIFHVDGDIQVGSEIMLVTAMDQASMTLTVTRGARGTDAVAHAAGVRTAPIIRFWPGTYMMNMTGQCPSAQLHGATQPETWIEYSYRMCMNGADWFEDLTGDYDGFMFDRTEDIESWIFWDTANSVDLDQNNVSDTFDSFDTAWLNGVIAQTNMFRAGHPGKPILRNLGDGRRFADYNGNHFESWPMLAGWDEWPGRTTGWHHEMLGVPPDYEPDWVDRIGGIAEWAAGSPDPNYTWVETYEDEDGPDGDGGGGYDNPFDQPGFTPNYQKMRYGLTSALLVGAYYSYEINTNGHGSLGLMWFDEYDDAGSKRGYLGYPVGEMTRLHSEQVEEQADEIEASVWGREYTGGYVLCNPLSHAQEVALPAGQWRRINGTQVPGVNNGAVEQGNITIPAYDGLILKRVE